MVHQVSPRWLDIKLQWAITVNETLEYTPAEKHFSSSLQYKQLSKFTTEDIQWNLDYPDPFGHSLDTGISHK